MTDTTARRIAASLTDSSIPGRTALHEALRQAEIDRNADLIARLAAEAGLSLAGIEASLEARRSQAA